MLAKRITALKRFEACQLQASGREHGENISLTSLTSTQFFVSDQKALSLATTIRFFPLTMSSFVSWPPTLQTDQLEHLTLLATTYALSHSLLYLPPHTPESPPPPTPTSAIHAPFSLFPTPIPRTQFDLAKKLQKAYNTLYARVAMDEKFLDEVMGESGVASVDDFTGELWRRWKAIREQGIVQVSASIGQEAYLEDR